jgi:galactokinase
MLNWEIERKLQDLTNKLFQKVEKYEWDNRNSQTDNRLDSLESSLREVCAENVRLLNRVQALEESRIEPMGENSALIFNALKP